jgi:hypothetical protein
VPNCIPTFAENLSPNPTKHHLAAHAPNPADQGLHFEQILGFLPYFCAIGNKNAGKPQQNARRERLFIRKSALSAIFCCGFAVEMC